MSIFQCKSCSSIHWLNLYRYVLFTIVLYSEVIKYLYSQTLQFHAVKLESLHRSVSALHDVQYEVELLLHVLHPPVHDGLLLFDVLNVVPHRLQRGLGVILVSLGLNVDSRVTTISSSSSCSTCLLTISSLAAFTVDSLR